MKTLFPELTHGTDAASETGSAQIAAWCGKRVSPEAIARNGAKPTCWQCALIWDKDRAAGAGPGPTPKMTLADCVRLLNSEECPNCRSHKPAKMVFCRTCYARLPGELKTALYRRYGKGFEQAYFASMARLKPAAPPAA